MSSSFIKIKVN